ncbi:MAG: hypothetical protein ABWY01_03275 [Pseudoxanthomonas sp.]
MAPVVRTCLVFVLYTASALASGIENDNNTAATETAASAAASMGALESQVRSDKRAFIEQQLQMSPKEAQGFWPLYEDYQSRLSVFNQRRVQNIVNYAEKYNAGDMDDASATTLAEQALQLEKDEAIHMEQAFKKLRTVLPAVKAARYLQVEAKIRALVRFEQAAQVPYVQ